MTDETIDTSAEAGDDTPVQDVAAPSETNLTIQDLTTCMQIIAVCGNRGAIKAEEMAVVGTVYNKIYKFLDASGALQKAPETTGEEGAGTATAETTADDITDEAAE